MCPNGPGQALSAGIMERALRHDEERLSWVLYHDRLYREYGSVSTVKWYSISPKNFIRWLLIPPVLGVLLFVVNCIIGVRPAEFFSGWGLIPGGVAFVFYELFFVMSWRICEADENGVWVRGILGRKRGGNWEEFVYVGLVSRTRTPDRASKEKSEILLICASEMPYKGHPKDEGYLLHKGTIVLPLVEESRRALKTYCQDYSEMLYKGK